MTLPAQLSVAEPDGRGGRRGAQLHRTLFILRDLSQGWCGLSTLSSRYQVTTRTIRRDVKFLKLHGFTIGERAGAVTNSAEMEWRVADWPERYDLTGASAEGADVRR